MATISNDTAAEYALDLAQAFQTIGRIIDLDGVSRVLVGQYLFDDLIGTDETAILSNQIPLLSAEMLEMLGDMVGPIIAKAIIDKWFTPPAVP